MLYEYVATYGDKYRIDSFKGHRELRKDHLELLNGKVYYNSETRLELKLRSCTKSDNLYQLVVILMAVENLDC